jgi:hypothetical protein
MTRHEIETRLKAIEQRNTEVALNKKWETSLTRKLSIAAITYMCAALTFLFILPQSQWFIAALVPTCGFLLSTLGLPPLKKWWAKKFL